jgi:hypothetical protein
MEIDGVALLPFLLSRSRRHGFSSLVLNSSSNFHCELSVVRSTSCQSQLSRCRRTGRITDDFMPRLHGRTRGAGVGGAAFLSHEAETKAEIGVLRRCRRCVCCLLRYLLVRGCASPVVVVCCCYFQRGKHILVFVHISLRHYTSASSWSVHQKRRTTTTKKLLSINKSIYINVVQLQPRPTQH